MTITSKLCRLEMDDDARRNSYIVLGIIEEPRLHHVDGSSQANQGDEMVIHAAADCISKRRVGVRQEPAALVDMGNAEQKICKRPDLAHRDRNARPKEIVMLIETIACRESATSRQ